jgi:RimJ/RimL family protein N-acetyltransferase
MKKHEILENEKVRLVPANKNNIDILIKWTLDPKAQGPYKYVPKMTYGELYDLFLLCKDRWYFLIEDTKSRQPLGRFYYRERKFHPNNQYTDWELNTFLANPMERGVGYGKAVKMLITKYLLEKDETFTVFAYTFEINMLARKSLISAGYIEAGFMPSRYYTVDKLPLEKCVLYIMPKKMIKYPNNHPFNKRV